MQQVQCLSCGARRSIEHHTEARKPLFAARTWLRGQCNGGACDLRHERRGELVRVGRPRKGLFIRKDPSQTGRIGLSVALAAELGDYCRFRRTPNGESVVEAVQSGDHGARAVLANRARGNYYLSCAWLWPALETGRRYYLEPAGAGVFRLARIELDGAGGLDRQPDLVAIAK